MLLRTAIAGPSPNSTSAWLWRGLGVTSIDLPQNSTSSNTGGDPDSTEIRLSNNLATLSHSTPRAGKHSRAKGVRFAGHETHQGISTEHLNSLQTLPERELRPVTNLCSEIGIAQGVKRCIGLASHEASRCDGHVISLTEHRFGVGLEYRSLASLLQGSEQRTFSQRLTWDNRLEIAVTLASSVVQLWDTSWLEPQWRLEDILFLQTSSSDTVQRLDFARPYLSSKACLSNESTETTLAVSGEAMLVNRRKMLFALGTALVELSCGHTIFEIESVEGHAVDIDMLSRLAQYVDCERGERLGDVIQNCIKCTLDAHSTQLDSEGLQELVFESIVYPLQQELHTFRGYSRVA